MDYPEEWNQLSRHERRKKIKELRRRQASKTNSVNQAFRVVVIITALILGIFSYRQLTRKSPEEIAVSLEGRVAEFAIEGRDHVAAGVKVDYKTNPPTSGAHLGQAENWGVYSKEIDDKAAVHGLEHGGIWISYKDVDETTQKALEAIGRVNSQSVIVSPRSGNDDKIVVVSWGRMMRLESADQALIQKYIDIYKNQSPEQLAK